MINIDFPQNFDTCWIYITYNYNLSIYFIIKWERNVVSSDAQNLTHFCVISYRAGRHGIMVCEWCTNLLKKDFSNHVLYDVS